MDLLGYISDRNREEIIKKNIGKDNFKNLKLSLNQAFVEFSKTIDKKTIDYLELIMKVSQRVPAELILNYPTYSNKHRQVVIVSDDNIKEAIDDLKKYSEVGFDTESEPTFKKGQPHNIVSIIQIATVKKCYIFKMSEISNPFLIDEITKDFRIKKIGVGLYGDYDRLKHDYNLEMRSIVNIDEIFKKIGSKDVIGAKQMVAIVLGQNITKSKKISRSNWAVDKLSDRQLNYASDDAFSGLDVYFELQNILTPFSHLLPERVCKLLCLDK